MSLNKLIYGVAKPLGGLAIARYLARRHPRILMYHRISPPGSAKGINADIFREQMQMIKQSFNVITLSALIKAHDRGDRPENAVVITFDDGYHDFADYAFPILRELDIPATLFVTTGFASGELWLWPDQIRYALENTSAKQIELPGISGILDVLGQSEQCWHRIADHCMEIPNFQKLQLIELLYQRVGVRKPRKVPDAYRPLSWNQIKEMTTEGLDIGSHSHSHPIMTQLNDSELREELVCSREAIRKHLNFTTPAFCYPNGQKIDFDANIQEKVHDAGYEYAVAAYPDINPLSDRLAINRYSACTSKSTFEKMVYGMSYFRL